MSVALPPHAAPASAQPAAPPAASVDDGDTAAAALAVEVAGLSHRFPRAARPPRKHGQRRVRVPAVPVDALSEVSLRVPAGSMTALLGPNGSGKTTLFRILSTQLSPTAADTLRLLGRDVRTEPGAVRTGIGVVFQHPSVDGKLTAAENLRCQAALYGLGRPEAAHRTAEALDRANLTDRASDHVETFSGGMQRRLEIAKAMMHRPELLLLDEPDTGLDPRARRDVMNQLEAARAAGTTVLLTTHLMTIAERCDRVTILSGGRVVADDTPASLRASLGSDAVTAVLSPGIDADAFQAELRAALPGEAQPTHVGVNGRRLVLGVADAAPMLAALSGPLSDRVARVSWGEATLEDVFFAATGEAARGGDT